MGHPRTPRNHSKARLAADKPCKNASLGWRRPNALETSLAVHCKTNRVATKKIEIDGRVVVH
jgi:hypothetical protein